MTTAIKICGIKTPEMARICASAGADYIGIVFCKKSPRFVSSAIAQSIASAAQDADIIPVAVFSESNANEIISICEMTRITHVQLHGEVSKKALYNLPEHLHKIYVNPKDNEDLAYLRPKTDYVLYDGEQAGSGQVINWSLINPQSTMRHFLAGGLTVDNVHAAITSTHPFGVDLSSGVEITRGEKSETLINEFIKLVKKIN